MVQPISISKQDRVLVEFFRLSRYILYDIEHSAGVLYFLTLEVERRCTSFQPIRKQNSFISTNERRERVVTVSPAAGFM